MGFPIDDLKICLRIFVVSVHQNSLLILLEKEELDLDTWSSGNV